MTDLEEAMERIESNPLERNPQDCLTVVAGLKQSRAEVESLRTLCIMEDLRKSQAEVKKLQHAIRCVAKDPFDMRAIVALEREGKLGHES